MFSFKLSLIPLALGACMIASVFSAPMPLTDAQKTANGQKLNQLREQNFQKSVQQCGPDTNSAAFKQCQRIFFFKEDEKLVKQFKGKTDKPTFDKFLQDKKDLQTGKRDIRSLASSKGPRGSRGV